MMDRTPKIRSARVGRSWTVSGEIQRAYDSLREASFKDFSRRLRALEAELLPVARGEFEQSELRRRIAEHILLGAYLREESVARVRVAFKRVEALGFRRLGRRVFAVCLLARSAALGKAGKNKKLAEGYLNNTLARIRRLPKTGRARRMLEESILLAAQTLGVVPSSIQRR